MSVYTHRRTEGVSPDRQIGRDERPLFYSEDFYCEGIRGDLYEKVNAPTNLPVAAEAHLHRASGQRYYRPVRRLTQLVVKATLRDLAVSA